MRRAAPPPFRWRYSQPLAPPPPHPPRRWPDPQRQRLRAMSVERPVSDYARDYAHRRHRCCRRRRRRFAGHFYWRGRCGRRGYRAQRRSVGYCRHIARYARRGGGETSRPQPHPPCRAWRARRGFGFACACHVVRCASARLRCAAGLRSRQTTAAGRSSARLDPGRAMLGPTRDGPRAARPYVGPREEHQGTQGAPPTGRWRPRP
eukprot:scaffold103185_cov63-Phaeocystis_antarctica.AAC.2